MSIFFLQEVHCTEGNKHDWRAEWGYQALFSCGSSKSAGVAILFNNNFNFQICKAFTDPEGRFIVCDLRAPVCKNQTNFKFRGKGGKFDFFHILMSDRLGYN